MTSEVDEVGNGSYGRERKRTVRVREVCRHAHCSAEGDG